MGGGERKGATGSSGNQKGKGAAHGKRARLNITFFLLIGICRLTQPHTQRN